MDLLCQLNQGIEVLRNTLEFLFSEASSGHCGGTDTDAGWGQRRDVTRSGVLVAGDVDGLENGLETCSVELDGLEVEQNHVTVGTARDEVVTHACEFLLEGLSVGDDLLLVEFVFGGESLLESDSEGSNGVVVGSTLMAGEDA